MRKLVLLPALLLGACFGNSPDTGLATNIKLPELPANLAVKAQSLPPITDNTMGGLVTDGADSDMRYNAEAHQKNKLIDLYNCVKDAINNGKEIKCL